MPRSPRRAAAAVLLGCGELCDAMLSRHAMPLRQKQARPRVDSRARALPSTGSRAGHWCLHRCALPASRARWRGAQDQQDAGVVASDFLHSADGWTRAGKDAASVEMLHAPMLVQGRDEGNHTWWFSAPRKFLGDQRDKYGGVLSMRVGFWEYGGSFVNSSASRGTFDVLLSSESAGMSLGCDRLLPPLAFIHNMAVELREDSGWVVVGTRGAPSRSDFDRVLSSLSSLWVRGGYYTGVGRTGLQQLQQRRRDAPHGLEPPPRPRP